MAFRHIVLVSDHSGTVDAVTQALAKNGRLSPDDVFRDLPSLIARLEQTHSPAAIVDVDALPGASLGALEPVVRRFSDTRFVLLASELQPRLLLEAMQVGARHFMLKKSIPDELASALHRLCPAGGSERSGHVVTIIPACGGCGATTLAVNLANEHQLLTAKDALVVDLDCAYASVPSYLALQGQYGILDILSRPGVIDAEVIATTALAFTPKLHVLPATATSRLPGTQIANFQRLDAVIQACRSNYAFTVIDAPRLALNAMVELARASDIVLLALQLTIKDLRVSRLMMQELQDHGVSGKNILPVICRFRRRVMMIEPVEAQRALGRDDLLFVGSDFASASQAINFGKPLSQAAPHSMLRREIQSLAEVLLNKHLPVKAAATTGR